MADTLPYLMGKHQSQIEVLKSVFLTPLFQNITNFELWTELRVNVLPFYSREDVHQGL